MITDYEHLPIGKYLSVLELAKVQDNDLAIVSALSGKTEDELLNMPITEYRHLADGAGFLFHQPIPAKVAKTYKVGELKLKLTDKAERITTAQYIDFKEYAKAGETDICKYLSVVLVPEGKTYNDGYDVTEVADAIREYLPTPDALGLRDFFLTRLGRLTADSLTYSRKMIARLTDREKKAQLTERMRVLTDFWRSGDGSIMLTILQRSPAVLGVKYMR